MKNPPLAFPLLAKSYGRQPLDSIIQYVVARDQRICQMCGADESCLCPYDEKPIVLFVRFIKPKDEGGTLEVNNLRTICSTCAEGLKAINNNSDPYNSNRTIRLTLGHIIDKSKGGEDIPANLRAVCSNCNEGLQNASPIKPDQLQLLSQIRRATITDQKAVLDWLLRKFKLRSVADL